MQDKNLTTYQIDSKIGSTAIYKQSSKNYKGVCITFNPAITTFSGKTAREFCNIIQQYEGQATMPYNTTTKDKETAATTGTATTELNDF